MLVKRGQKSRAARELDDDMEGQLIFGNSLGPVFWNGKSEPPAELQRAAWEKHRATLMKPENTDVGPGCRPAGWWLFDLRMGAVPDRWCTSIPLLIERNLIDAAEAAQIEQRHRELAPPPRVAATGSYAYTAREDDVADPAIRRHMRQRRLEVARCAAVWHAWRGRERQAASWAADVARLEAALGDAT